jgi:hypothetical protein
MICMPLRNASHHKATSILSDEVTADFIKNDVVRHYLTLAEESLMFPNMKSIAFVHREMSGTLTKVWQCNSLLRETNRDSAGEGSYSSSVKELQVHQIDPPQYSSSLWLIATGTVPLSSIPDQELASFANSRRVRSPLGIGLAACVEGKRSINAKFFSTLPLPINGSLPIHLSASFLLASDRRSIRLDTSGSMETKLNKWILSSLVPPLYLYLLECLLVSQYTKESNIQWWPLEQYEASSHTDQGASATVVDALYQHLSSSPRRVFRSRFASTTVLAPKDAILIDEILITRNVWQFIASPNFVSVPQSPKLRGHWTKGLQNLTPAILQSRIMENNSDFVDAFRHMQINLEDLASLTKYITQRDVSSLHNLPLIPLLDSSLGAFEHGTRPPSQKYFATSRASAALFPLSQIVDPKYLGSDSSILKGISNVIIDKDLNIVTMTGEEAVTLIQLRDIPTALIWEPTPPDCEWIKRLWEEFTNLKLPSSSPHLTSLPLIRSRKGVEYVSIDSIRNAPSVLCIEPFDGIREDIFESLESMGCTVVVFSSLHSEVRKDLESQPRALLGQILQFLASLGEQSMCQKFAELRDEDSLRPWLRDELTRAGRNQQSIPNVAKTLPIWRAFNPAGSAITQSFIPAENAIILPAGVGALEVIRWINVQFIEFSTSTDTLKLLNARQLNYADLRCRLSFPDVLAEQDFDIFKRLTRSLIAVTRRERNSTLTITIPNVHGTLGPSNALFKRDALFLASLSTASFIHPSFQDLEDVLCQFGMKTQGNITAEIFKECASAVQNNVNNLSVIALQERARQVFQFYCGDLALRLGVRSTEWKDLENIYFIPAAATRHYHHALMDSSAYVAGQTMFHLIPPTLAVLEAHESVCWTQRRRLLVQPGPDDLGRITMVNPNFGLPTAIEVVCPMSLHVIRLNLYSRFVICERSQRRIPGN